MHRSTIRIVLDHRPYLVTRGDDGRLDRAFGPFLPGAEPSLAECDASNEVDDPAVLRALEELLPISPPLPPNDESLSGTT